MEQGSNTDKAERETNMGSGQCTRARMLLQVRERPEGGKEFLRKEKGFSGLKLPQFASALPEFSCPSAAHLGKG